MHAVLHVNLTNLIHNFENNYFRKQFCSDNGKRSYFTALFCNNTNIYSSQSTVQSTIAIAALALLSGLLARIGLLLLLSLPLANYSCFSQWSFSVFHFQKKRFDNGKHLVWFIHRWCCICCRCLHCCCHVFVIVINGLFCYCHCQPASWLVLLFASHNGGSFPYFILLLQQDGQIIRVQQWLVFGGLRQTHKRGLYTGNICNNNPQTS